MKNDSLTLHTLLKVTNTKLLENGVTFKLSHGNGFSSPSIKRFVSMKSHILFSVPYP
jgi:hypothetical protein